MGHEKIKIRQSTLHGEGGQAHLDFSLLFCEPFPNMIILINNSTKSIERNVRYEHIST